MQFPLGTRLGKCVPLFSQFPVGAPLGKCVPLRPPRVGCTFRKAPQRETTSHSKGKFRDAFFESRSPPAHPESPSHFGRIRARNHRPIRPPINKEASSRTAGHEVHREFRTQRRPLNVAFVLRRTVEQGTSCPDAREDVSFRKMDRPPSAMGATLPARPFWRLQPCCPDLPWWGDPLRRPSYRAAS